MELGDDVQLDKLTDQGMVILQPRKGYRFSIDAVLLARFATVKPGFKVLDLGTGSGVIPLLLSTREKDLQIVGVEIQAELAALAKKSVALNKKEDCIAIWEGDLRELGREHHGKWDLVVSNPPYFKINVGKISGEESAAIARHELKCSLEDIVRVAAKLLKSRGYFAVIHRPERLGELFNLLSQYGLNPTRLKPVYPTMDRRATMFLLEAVKGSHEELRLLPPLVVYETPGRYTEEVERIFAGQDV